MTFDELVSRVKATGVDFNSMDSKQRAAKLFGYRIDGQMLKQHLANMAGEEIIPGQDMGDGTFNAYCALIEELLAEDI